MAKQKAKIGDLFVVPLTDGSFAVGKILWRGVTPRFCDELQIGIYQRVSQETLAAVSAAGLKPLQLFYVVAQCFEDRHSPVWQIVGHETLADYEQGLTRRRIGIHGYFDEQILGRIPFEEEIAEGTAQLPSPTAWHIQNLFGIPHPNSETSESCDSSFPWSEAVEWTDALARSSDESQIKEALSAILSADYAEMDECYEAVAAAEVVAAAKGKPTMNLPEVVKQWIAKHQSKFDSSLVDLAIRAVERVRADSELQQEWDESDSLNDWKKHVTGLLKRLRA